MKKAVAISILSFALLLSLVFGILIYSSEVHLASSSTLLVRITPNSVMSNLTGQTLIGIHRINGTSVSTFRELQVIFGKIDKSKSINIEYSPMQEPTKIIAIATPSVDPMSTEDYYSTNEFGIYPSESLVYCLKKNSILSNMKLMAGDVIIFINNKPFFSITPEEFVSTINQKKIQASILRNGQIVNLSAEYPEKLSLSNTSELGYLSPNSNFFLSAFSWFTFTSDSVLMSMKGYSCYNL